MLLGTAMSNKLTNSCRLPDVWLPSKSNSAMQRRNAQVNCKPTQVLYKLFANIEIPFLQFRASHLLREERLAFRSPQSFGNGGTYDASWCIYKKI